MKRSMSSKNVWGALIVALLVSALASVHGAEMKKKGDPATAAPLVQRGDPPPGNAMSISVAQARAALKRTLRSGFAGERKCCVAGECVTGYFETSELRFRPDGFDLAQRCTFDQKDHRETKLSVRFKKDQDYVAIHREDGCRCNGGPCSRAENESHSIGVWIDEATAQEFADAFNRLLYGAYHGELEQEEAAFSAAVAAWRAANPKPPLSAEADKHWILAENAIKEKNLDSAAEHYEAALEIQSTWPAGWFDLAMIYAEQNNYADASDAMKHYVELVPDAPNAQQAREQMIIWEDKAKQ